MDYKIFKEVVIISGLAIPIVLFCRKIKIPIIVGFLVSGIIMNSSGVFFNVMNFMNHEAIDVLAELGIICLLFTVGLEFSLKQINELKKTLFIGGTIQVGATIAIVACILMFFFKTTFQIAVFYGCVLSLSSTALVLSLLQKNGDITRPYGRMTLTVLIYQDIASVLMVIVFPLLGSSDQSSSMGSMILALLIKLFVLLAVSFVSYKWIIPKLLYQVAKTQSSELFIIAILFIFLSFVFLSGLLGISLALGAFIAGVLIAESPYSHRALGSIMPFKDVFTSIFFVSIGIMLDLNFALHNVFSILGITLAILVLKTAIAAAAVSVLKYPPRTAFCAGLALCQIGEFSFVLFQMGSDLGIIQSIQLNYLLASSILSMILTPFIIQAAPSLYGMFSKIFHFKEVKDEETKGDLSNHLIIVGFGVVGRRVAFGAKMAGLKYCVVESNPDTVKTESKKGVPIYYGDASQEAVLEFVHIDTAAAVALTMPGNSNTVRIVKLIKRLNPNVTLIVRSLFEASAVDLEDAGANQVVADEKESSFEMLARILRYSMISKQNIQSIVEAQNSEDANSLVTSVDRAEDVQSSKNHLATIVISDNSPLAGKSLIEADFRKKYGLVAVTINKVNSEILNPEDKILPGYSLLVVGKREKINAFAEMQLQEDADFSNSSYAYDRS